jgi:opacity protein-like surface antigen
MKIAQLAAVTLSLASAAAVAQPSAYVSASAGTVKLNVDCAGASRCDRTDVGFKLIGGYFFSPKLAVELGYVDYGKAKASDSVLSSEIASSAVGIGVAAHQDLAPQWDLFARLGVARMTTKVSATVSGVGSASDSASNAMPYGGLGVGYRLRPNMSLELSWDTTRTKYDKNGLDESASLNMFSAGMSFKF